MRLRQKAAEWMWFGAHGKMEGDFLTMTVRGRLARLWWRANDPTTAICALNNLCGTRRTSVAEGLAG